MAVPFPSFQEYLVQQKQDAGTGGDNTDVHVVVGNTAGDADSIISALTYGFIQSMVTKNTSTSRTTLIPIVSITQRDLETQRPEVSYMFRALGLEQIADSLRYIDDPIVVSSSKAGPGKRKLTLVDHNRAEEAFSSDAWEVVEILDHHQDEHRHLDTCQGDARQIAFENDKATVASTCTLVAERLKELSCDSQYPSTLSSLLLGTILLDSVNMIPAAGKGTPRDKAAIENLLQQTDWSTISSKTAVSDWWLQDDLSYPPAADSAPSTDRMFEALQAAKFDAKFWNELSVEDALRLDYKRFVVENKDSMSHVFGASSVLLPVEDFLAKPDSVPSILEYMTNTVHVSFLAILFFYKSLENDQNCRQLILCEKKSICNNMESLVSFLIKDGTLELEEIQDSDSVCEENEQLSVRLFDQKNTKASRKQVAPLIRDYYESHA